ncbi:MAG: repressor [Proteobacteria bacterium]|nr:repressor [Pseudomonadota bacterium]
MEKTYEMRRQHLKTLVDKLGRGGIAAVAKKIDVNASYLSRCLYPPEKAGRKNIGDEIATRLDEHFPSWKGASITSLHSPAAAYSVEPTRDSISPAAVMFGHVFDKLSPADQFDLWVDLKKRVMNYPEVEREYLADIVKYLTLI